MQRTGDANDLAEVVSPPTPSISPPDIQGIDDGAPSAAAVRAFFRSDEALAGAATCAHCGRVCPTGLRPHEAGRLVVAAYQFDGFWEDIGTIASFFESNLQLTAENPPFRFGPSALFCCVRFFVVAAKLCVISTIHKREANVYTHNVRPE